MPSQETNQTMIDSTERLVLHLEKVSQETPVCAIDTEANSLHSYRESLCLIQFAVRDESVLIDPLAIEDLSALGNYLSEATVWMHGGDYDLTMFKREFGKLPAVVYDTQIGARLLGVRRFGLGDLVNRYFSIELSKSSQKADWGKRPLSAQMIAYALNDVDYLLEMGDLIVAELKERGREGWFEESCIAARQRVWERDDSKEEMWRIQGCGKFGRHELACLRSLWNWRDAEAKDWDRPSFMVATNAQLLEWSTDLSADRKVTFPRHFRQDRVKRFWTAFDEVQALPEEEWPERLISKRKRRDRDFDKRLEGLLQSRDKIAEKLDLEGSLIASRAILESLASGEAEPANVLLAWQRECLGL